MKNLNESKPWAAPLAGGLIGLVYVFLDEGLLDMMSGNADAWLTILHECVDAGIPILLGISLGIAANLVARQARLNSRLSLEKNRLERELLSSTLISQILHDVQNPIHNIAAALEDPRVPEDKREIVQRNMERLNDLKTRYGKWGAVMERIDPTEPLDLLPWLRSFMDEKIRPQLKSSGVQYVQHGPDARVFVHPLLLEQMMLTLYTNALEAAQDAGGDARKTVSAEIRFPEQESGFVEFRLENDGAFPHEVVTAQGTKPVASRRGLGLGLLLLGKMLEQIGGRLRLANENGRAAAVMTLPGERP